jgi:hypothetical protein
MTRALVEAEDGPRPDPECRVRVVTCEVRHGRWDGLGEMGIRLADTCELFLGDEARHEAGHVLAERQRTVARTFDKGDFLERRH